MPRTDASQATLPAAEPLVTGTSTALIWDLPVRLFHWLLVGLIAASWWTGKQHAMDWHRRSGYGIVALLIFRIYWGLVGGRTARFSRFVRGPRAALDYARGLATGRPDRVEAGHNPLGGWSVVLMLGTLVVMVTAGLFAVDVDGIESGPLADLVSFDHGRAAAHVHGLVFNLLLTLIAVHLAAIVFHAVRLRHNLIAPMVSGRRRVDGDQPVEPLGASPWKAAIGIGIAALCTYAIASGRV